MIEYEPVQPVQLVPGDQVRVYRIACDHIQVKDVSIDGITGTNEIFYPAASVANRFERLCVQPEPAPILPIEPGARVRADLSWTNGHGDGLARDNVTLMRVNGAGDGEDWNDINAPWGERAFFKAGDIRDWTIL